jgi:hypothetical protein
MVVVKIEHTMDAFAIFRLRTSSNIVGPSRGPSRDQGKRRSLADAGDRAYFAMDNDRVDGSAKMITAYCVACSVKAIDLLRE